jgi:hypothetical protein
VAGGGVKADRNGSAERLDRPSRPTAVIFCGALLASPFMI